MSSWSEDSQHDEQHTHAEPKYKGRDRDDDDNDVESSRASTSLGMQTITDVFRDPVPEPSFRRDDELAECTNSAITTRKDSPEAVVTFDSPSAGCKEEDFQLVIFHRRVIVVSCLVLVIFIFFFTISATLVFTVSTHRTSNQGSVHTTASSESGTDYHNTSTTSFLTESDLFAYLRNVLINYTNTTDVFTFLDPDSSQSRAFSWLISVKQDPSLHIWFLDEDLIDRLPRFLQRYALIVLAYSASGTQNTIPWMQESLKHECDWRGVRCDVNHKVTEIDLSLNSLTGSLPDTELGLMTSLTHFNLSQNQLKGSFPAALMFSTMTDLKEVDIHCNLMAFQLPQDLHFASHALQYLDLHSNIVTGTLPRALKNLTTLRHLDLTSTQLHGDIFDFLPFWPELETLFVGYTKLQGELPSFSSSLSNLDIRDLPGVKDIPTTIGHLTNLKTLRLGRQTLTGTLPSELGLCTNLHNLLIQRSQLTGSIPSEFGQLTQLITLSLVDLGLTGTVPEELADLTNLVSLVVPTSNLSGALPSKLGTFSNLKSIELAGNFKLEVPDELCQPTIQIVYPCEAVCSSCTCRTDCV